MALILITVLGGLGMVWAVKVWRERRRERRLTRDKVVCPVCGEVFTHLERSSPVTCPACGRAVERQALLDI